MATVIKAPTKRKRGRPPVHDWPTLLDGKWRRLTKDEDFPTVASAHNFRMMAYTAGSRMSPPRGVHAHVVDDTTLELKGYRKR